jgi:hypothetical protein
MIPKEVLEKLVGKKGGFTRNLFYLMKEVGVSYNDLCEMPIPAILILLEELNSHVERENKAMKKK